MFQCSVLGPHRRMVLVGVATLLGSLSVQAAPQPCRLRLVGPAPQDWLVHAEQLALEMARGSWRGSCEQVWLEADSSGARLTLIKSDQRRAERHLKDPAELIATVQALSIDVLEPSRLETEIAERAAPAPVASKATPAADSDPASVPAQPPNATAAPKKQLVTAPRLQTSSDLEARSPLSVAPYSFETVFSGQFGFRHGAHHLISPQLAVSAAALLNRWELGMLGRFEAHYVNGGGNNKGAPETQGFVFGLNAGLRQPLGNWSLRGGGLALLAALHESNGAKSGRAEMRLGAYTGAIWPRQSQYRLRIDLGAEVVPYNIGASEQNARGDFSLPWWAFTFGVGMEFG